MNWYTVNDPCCEFKKEGNKVVGRINGNLYELTDSGFKLVGLARNPYMPDEITEPLYLHARMIPHHIAYAKEKARSMRKRFLRRNGPYIPSEVKNVITTHAKMLPHHLAYARGVMQSKFGKMSDLED